VAVPYYWHCELYRDLDLAHINTRSQTMVREGVLEVAARKRAATFNPMFGVFLCMKANVMRSLSDDLYQVLRYMDLRLTKFSAILESYPRWLLLHHYIIPSRDGVFTD